MNENAVPPPRPTRLGVNFTSNAEQTRVGASHTGWLEGETRAWHVRAWKAVLQTLAIFVEGRKLLVNWRARAA
jgi:hypothetical protein